MRIYTPIKEWEPHHYQLLVRLAVEKRCYSLLVVRSNLSSEGNEFLSEISDSIVSEWMGSEWPGTILLDQTKVRILKHLMSEEVGEAFLRATDHLWGWLSPRLPEDVSFLRKDGRPWFVSITHEKDLFFKLQDEEVFEVEQALGVCLKDDGVDRLPNETY